MESVDGKVISETKTKWDILKRGIHRTEHDPADSYCQPFPEAVIQLGCVNLYLGIYILPLIPSERFVNKTKP